MANVDKDFVPITSDNTVNNIEDVRVKRIFNRDDDYEEVLTMKFIDQRIDELNRKINKLRNDITEYNRLRVLVHNQARTVILKP